MSNSPQILRAVSPQGQTFRRIGSDSFHKTGAIKAVTSAPAKKSSNAYAAALVNRLNEDWPIAVLSADAATRWSLRQLRARSRDLERNGGIHSAYLSLVEADTIGSKGIGLQMKIKVEENDRTVDDPKEREFLKALKSKVERLHGIKATDKRRTFIQRQEEPWKSLIMHAARAIKAGEDLFEETESGEMIVEAGTIDRYACFCVESEWREFSKRGNCDVTGKHSMMDLNRLTLRTSARDGDALLLVYRGYPNRWGLAFQLIEGDYLDDYYNVEQLPNGNRVRMGVELDPFGRKVAFWVFAHHPGDYGVSGVQGYDSRRRRIAALGCAPDWYFTDGRPEAVQCIHVSKSRRAEETRAVPWITPAMQLIHNIEAYKEAEITAARAEACKHVFYERDMFTADGMELPWDSSTGQLTDEMQPGGGTELPPGYRANYIDPKHPNANMPDFLRAMKREVAMAVNKSYPILFGDLSEVNYSSLRGGLQNQRECDKMDQAWFGDDVFEPMFRTFLEMSLMSGAVPFGMSQFKRLNAPEFKFRRWPWVDPKNDAETAILLIENKLRTRAQVIADMSSDDFEETIDELEYEAEYIAAKPALAAADKLKADLEKPAPPQIKDKEEKPEEKTKERPAVKSAFLGDVCVSELPEETQTTIALFAKARPESKVIRYQMTAPELIDKADQHNLETAREHVKQLEPMAAADAVRARSDKSILILNDRIIDGHHHLAKAERGNVTSSLSVIDLTPLRYQVTDAPE